MLSRFAGFLILSAAFLAVETATVAAQGYEMDERREMLNAWRPARPQLRVLRRLE